MNKIVTLLLLVMSMLTVNAQHCINPGYDIELDNSIHTIPLNGDCGNTMDAGGSVSFNPADFEYDYSEYGLVISGTYDHNCACNAYLTVQATDDMINIQQHATCPEELSTCSTYDKYHFSFPKAPKGYYQVNVLGYEATFSNVLQSSENLLKTGFKVSPNPASDYIRVEVPNCTGSFKVNVLNLCGSIVYQEYSTMASHLIPAVNFSAGFYLIEVVDAASANRIGVKKVMVKKN